MRLATRRAAFTLVELLVAITIVGIVTVAITRAYSVGIEYGQRLDASRLEESQRLQLEARLRTLVQGAWLAADELDPYSYFVASVGGSAAAGGGNTGGGDADTLTFTAADVPPPVAYLNSTDDFETLNERFGPQGGVSEIALTLTPYGDAGENTGLFLRVQRPADGDPTQGGYEEVLDPDVSAIRFEFFDGQQWGPDWDSGLAGEHRLPAAVRVYYTLGDAPERALTIRLPLSDVTPDNPAGAGGGV